MVPVVVTWRDLAKHWPWSKGQLIGNGIYCAPWHSASSFLFLIVHVFSEDQVYLID